jgi:hypothetical protein
MTTPRTRSLVSLAAVLTLTLGLGCATSPSRLATDPPTPVDAPPAVHFDNASRDYVQVYLVGIRREWSLGRVAPGARATLRVPEEALDEYAGQMRLAVLPGRNIMQPIASDARVAMALARPAAEILGQRWTFSQWPTYGELTPLPLGAVPTVVGRP